MLRLQCISTTPRISKNFISLIPGILAGLRSFTQESILHTGEGGEDFPDFGCRHVAGLTQGGGEAVGQLTDAGMRKETVAVGERFAVDAAHLIVFKVTQSGALFTQSFPQSGVSLVRDRRVAVVRYLATSDIRHGHCGCDLEALQGLLPDGFCPYARSYAQIKFG